MAGGHVPDDQPGSHHALVAERLPGVLAANHGAASRHEGDTRLSSTPGCGCLLCNRRQYWCDRALRAREHPDLAARLQAEWSLDTRTLAGRRRLGVAKVTEALNTPVQGTWADGLKLALARLFASREEAPNTRLIAVVHDEIVAECPEADA
jgi:DNA polymerase family A